jgi:hypothetical protein
MMSNEERIEKIEKQLAEIINLKGIPGRQGVPGNIEAAVDNASRVLDEKLQGLYDRLDAFAGNVQTENKASAESLRREFESLRTEMRENFEHLQAGLRNQVDLQIVSALHDYGVVSSRDNRVIEVS